MLIFITEQISRRKQPPSSLSAAIHLYCTSTTTPTSSSKLHTKYSFQPPPSLRENPASTRPEPRPNAKKEKPPYRPPSSLDRSGAKPLHSDLPFDFRFSYTESSKFVRPIGLREPKYSPFGPERLDRVWTGVCAPAVDPKEGKEEDLKLEEKRKAMREKIQGQPLTNAERKALVERFQRHRTKKQINIGKI